MNGSLALAGWLMFAVFVALLVVRSVHSEREGSEREGSEREGGVARRARTATRLLDVGIGVVAVALTVLLGYLFTSTLGLL